MKQRIGDLIWGRDPRYGHAFDYVMIVLIVVSVCAMAVETLPDFESPSWSQTFLTFDWVIVVLFTIEYALRIWTAPSKLRYVLSFWGLIDFLAIAPFWSGLLFGLPGGEALFSLRVLRLAKLLRFVANMEVIERTFALVWREMLVFFFLAMLIMFIAAVGVYTFEHEAQPDVFVSIPHTLWFAAVSLTTVGYGDIVPITAGGKTFTFLVLMIGVAIVALPVGFVSSAFSQARDEERQRRAGQKRAREDAERSTREIQDLVDDPD